MLNRDDSQDNERVEEETTTTTTSVIQENEQKEYYELANLIREGPKEIVSVIEGVFDKMETNMRHNSEFLQNQAKDVLNQVEKLEGGLQDLLKRIEQFAKDIPEIKIEQSAKDIPEIKIEQELPSSIPNLTPLSAITMPAINEQ